MVRDRRYDVLFEPVRIGPVVARNRFYQVPHCTGMGYERPAMHAAMRGIKAEGGWGVVCTEYTSIHPTSDDAGFPSCSLWDEDDVRTMSVVADAIHEHGALAGTQLWHGGLYSGTRLTRELPIAPTTRPIGYFSPLHARAMDLDDIRQLRRWQVDAARRAQRAGFDIVYVYAGHAYLPAQFLSRRFNHRSDAYGGSLENRVRLVREMIEETIEAVGHRCAVAIRFSIDELAGASGLTSADEGRDIVALLADHPDLWDVNVADYRSDSGSARFFEEGFQEEHQKWVKPLTSKPVVGVGRFTSPDAMVRQVRRGILDLIGAARPSIADPFLPHKVETGRIDDIRECIGCNICRAWFKAHVPIRCTQNPTMGEEWRRNWHPETIAQRASADRVLVVGAGPAGLEAARALGQRGYEVTIAEREREPGGHVRHLARLPGLASVRRVIDWRLGQIRKMPQVDLFLESNLSAADAVEFGAEHVIAATGCTWVRDGTGRTHTEPIPGARRSHVLAADDLFDGVLRTLQGPVVIYDDDHYVVASALAERLITEGLDVMIATPAPEVALWTKETDEHHLLIPHLHALGTRILPLHRLECIRDEDLIMRQVQSGTETHIACRTLILVTSRKPEDSLVRGINEVASLRDGQNRPAVHAIGDCVAPGFVADAVYAGHRFAREFQSPPDGPAVLRERVVLGAVA